jgi:hypothetical protein
MAEKCLQERELSMHSAVGERRGLAQKNDGSFLSPSELSDVLNGPSLGVDRSVEKDGTAEWNEHVHARQFPDGQFLGHSDAVRVFADDDIKYG